MRNISKHQLTIIPKMQDLARLKLIYNLTRSISTCNSTFNKYAAREGKFISKIMRGDQVKRKWYMQNSSGSPDSQAPKKSTVPPNPRRNTVLNKIFMKYITDLMATGEVAPEIVGKGIEVTRVSVTPDFHQVNVFWLARDADKKDELVEQVLTRAEGPLRHELSQLRVMGVVPIIKFVKDKEFLKFIEIDRRLAVADFGEDFVPTDPTLRLKTTPVFNLKLSPEVWENIEKLEADVDEDEPERAEEPLPEMRHDVLGIDHARIMAKVKSSMDKSRTAFQNRSLNICNRLPRDEERSSVVTEYLTVKQRNAAFSAFLTKRQLDEKHRRKYAYDSDDELDLFDERELDDDDEILDIDIHAEKIEER